MNSHNISCFQRADLLPMTAYKPWWIVGLWVQGETESPDCINTEEVKPRGRWRGATCSGMPVLKAGLRSPSALQFLLFVLHLRDEIPTEITGCWMQPFGGTFVRNYCLGSCWEPVELPPPPIYHLYLSCIPYGDHLPGNPSPQVSRPVPTVSYCHLATSDHLEIYPTIKSFSRNLAVQTWNARQSSSGWATQSQSWTV